MPKAQEPAAPTHWEFGQLASIVGAPASYLRQPPALLAGINLQCGLTNHRAERVKTFETEDGRTELRKPQDGSLDMEGRAKKLLDRVT